MKKMAMSADQTISASKFKAKCLEILGHMGDRKLSRLTITKHGRPVAVLVPPDEPESSARQLYGFMEGSVVGADACDLTAPVIDEELVAARGALHR